MIFSCSDKAVNGLYLSRTDDVLIDYSKKFSESESSLIFRPSFFSGNEAMSLN